MPTRLPRLPPFSIFSAKQEHQADFIAAINRVLYDIAHELNCSLEDGDLKLQQDPSEAKSRPAGSVSQLPIRFVFEPSQLEMARNSDDCITVTPVPFRFNRNRQSWSQCAVLDWKGLLQESDPLKDFHFPPEALLVGHLYRYLTERETIYDLIPCISGTGKSETFDTPSEYYSYTQWRQQKDGRPVAVSGQRDLKQKPPPEWTRSASLAKKQYAQLRRLYLDITEKIDRYSHRFIVLLPVYDIRPYGQVFGDLVACLMLNIGFLRHASQRPPDVIDETLRSKYEDAIQAVVNNTVNPLTRLSELIAAENHKAAIIQASTQQPRWSHDLLEHFIYSLRFAQSWEAAHVYRNNRPLYSYRWERKSDRSGGDEWKRIDSFDANWLNRPNVQAIFAPNGLPSCLSQLLVQRTQLEPLIDVVQDEAISWGEPGFFSSKGSATDDLGELSSIQVIFEFTRTARIPGRDSDYRKAFCRELQFQQLDVLRAVRPAVRMRRAAVRNAVSAIMGRNMSHNIGSHVLARLAAAELEVDRKPGERGTVAARTARQSLLSYLQKRMDFLAEVATADVCHWTQPVSLASALSRMNFDDEYRRNIGKEPDHAGKSLGERAKDTAPAERPLLLSYITGKDDLVASVEFDLSDKSSSDFLFSCPGGEVGVHALYVILENIIRNSARHGAHQQRPPSGAIVLRVSARSNDHSPHLIELRIVDTHTRLDANGQARHGKRIPDDVNAALGGDGLLDVDGRPNAKNWGVREMQICAHYLRSFPLSALESRRFDLESHRPEDRAVLCAEAIDFNLSEDDGLTHRLGYVMYLQRPRLLAFLLDEDVRCGDVGRGFFASSPELGILVCRIRSGDNAEEALRLVAGYSAVVACGERSVAALRRAESGPVAREAKDGVDVGKSSRESIEAVASSPEGAARSEHQNAARARLRAGLPMVRITLTEDELVSLVNRIRIDEEPGTLQWMDAVFDKLGHRYLGRREHLKTRKLHGVWAVDETWPADAPTPGAFVEGQVVVAPRTCSEGDPTYPLTMDWLEALQELLGAPPRPSDFLGAAWLEHAQVGAKDEIESSGCNFWEAFRQPANGNEGTQRWISVEPDFFECAHRHHRERLRTNGGGSSEILAAATARVAILDERVQKALAESVRRQPLRRWWAGTGVWVPERDDCNLDYPDWAPCRRFLEEPTALRWQWPIDILVIHLTVLEKLRSKRQEEQPNISLDECLTELREGTCAKGDTEVVVVTGRGITGTSASYQTDRIETARFLPISALHEHVVTRPSKLGLMRALWSARRVNSAS